MSGDTETGTLLDVAASGGQVRMLAVLFTHTEVYVTSTTYPMFRFSSMRDQADLNAKMVVILAPQPSRFYKPFPGNFPYFYGKIRPTQVLDKQTCC